MLKNATIFPTRGQDGFSIICENDNDQCKANRCLPASLWKGKVLVIPRSNDQTAHPRHQELLLARSPSPFLFPLPSNVGVLAPSLWMLVASSKVLDLLVWRPEICRSLDTEGFIFGCPEHVMSYR